MENASNGFRDLAAWQRGMDLVELVYAVTRTWPSEERFGLIGQIRRAAVSVPSNLAEGKARPGPREYLHHVSIAFGSLAEVEPHILIAGRLAHIEPETEQTVIDAVIATRRPLSGLLRSLRTATR